MPFYSLGFILENSLRVSCRVFQKLEMFRIPKAELLFGECSFPRFLCSDLISLDFGRLKLNAARHSVPVSLRISERGILRDKMRILRYANVDFFYISNDHVLNELNCALCITGEIISECFYFLVYAGYMHA